MKLSLPLVLVFAGGVQAAGGPPPGAGGPNNDGDDDAAECPLGSPTGASVDGKNFRRKLVVYPASMVV